MNSDLLRFQKIQRIKKYCTEKTTKTVTTAATTASVPYDYLAKTLVLPRSVVLARLHGTSKMVCLHSPACRIPFLIRPGRV